MNNIKNNDPEPSGRISFEWQTSYRLIFERSVFAESGRYIGSDAIVDAMLEKSFRYDLFSRGKNIRSYEWRGCNNDVASFDVRYRGDIVDTGVMATDIEITA